MSRKALLIVDMQNDFMPKGPLPVAEADSLVPIINELMSSFSPVIASLDYHPDHHVSFAETHPGVGEFQEIKFKDKLLKVWPKHCVQGTLGAELTKGLNKERMGAVFNKGTSEDSESFSVFFDVHGKEATSCHRYLKEEKVDTLYICGVASEFCVYESAKDAIALGYQVFVITDACKGIDKKEELKAFKDLEQRGAHLISRCALHV